MIENLSFTCEKGGVRLDAAVLLTCPTSTRTFVREAIAAGDILIGRQGETSTPRKSIKGMKLRAGETVHVRRLLESSDNLVAPEPSVPFTGRPEIRPCFESPTLLAFDKPAGMPVQPLTCRETGTLMNTVVAAHPECRALGPALAELGESPLMAGALHRIDAGTSGLVLVARDIDTFTSLRAQFAAQTVEKTYLALVEGAVACGGTLEHDLIHDPTLPFCRMIDARHDRHSPIAAALKAAERGGDGHRASSPAGARPLHAVTVYRPIGRTTVENEERTLLEVRIFTGVTHQIRAQLALAGMHIVNDRLYGAFAVENQTGHCLHALAVTFRDTATGEKKTIRTQPPHWATGF